MPRREALKWMATAAAAPALGGANAVAQSSGVPAAGARTPTDPDLISPSVPWKKLLTEDELRTVSALCDVIIPEDAQSPSASKVGVPDYINEYVSSPYAVQQGTPNQFRPGPKLQAPEAYPAVADERSLIRGGLVWINTESRKRYGREFADLSQAEKEAICDEISLVSKARLELRHAAVFFAKFRDLTAGGFYTTLQGMKDIGYVGNVPLAKFDGPPPEVLKHLKLA